jgi:hypothetical protein
MALAVHDMNSGDAADGSAYPLVAVDDVRNEVLEMNSYAMHLCQEKNFDEAQECLETARLRVRALGDAINANAEGVDTATLNAQVLAMQQLEATTLNNLGVVECHRGDYESSLEHLTAAQGIEFRAGIQSPSTALNLCAVYNAVQDYERASALALEAISMLNATDAGLTDETQSLWGAAWHNLGIAELNCDRQTRNVDVLFTFRNAMAATKDLLGAKHPMTVAVHDTYRAIRDRLKHEGTFKERTPTALPRLRANNTMPSPPSPDKPTSHALTPRTNTHGNGRYIPPPLASRFTGMPAYTNERKPGTAQSARSASHGGGSSPRRPPQDLFHPSQSTLGARRLYHTRHPLIQQVEGRLPAIQSPRSTMTQSYDTQPRPPPTASKSTRPRKAPPRQIADYQQPQHQSSQQQQQQQQQSLQLQWHAGLPQQQQQQQQQQAVRGNAYAGGADRVAPKRRLSELLLGDMWVEVQVPRSSPGASPTFSGAVGYGVSGVSGGERRDAAAMAVSQPSAVRPGYGEALYVIDPADAALEPISEPATYAALDRVALAPQLTKPAVSSSTTPQSAFVTPGPVAIAARPSEGAISGERGGRSTAAVEIADALGKDLSKYPSLRALVDAQDGAA